MRRSVTAAVAALEPRDRLRLRCYYAQDLTLAQIGRMLNESEATASRHLSRARREIRAAVERDLRAQRMSDAEIADCFAAVVSDSASLDLAEMLGSDLGSGPGLAQAKPRPDPARKNADVERSKGKERSRAGQRNGIPATTAACVDAETLAAWADGGLPKAEAAAVELHLAECERCTAMVATFARTTPDAPAAESLWTRWHLRWLVPLATAATVAALWVLVPRPDSPQMTTSAVHRRPNHKRLRPHDAAPASHDDREQGARGATRFGASKPADALANREESLKAPQQLATNGAQTRIKPQNACKRRR